VFINSKTDKEMIRKSKEQETDGKKKEGAARNSNGL